MTKIIKVRTRDVRVDDVDVTEAGQPATRQVTARTGNTMVEGRISFGAIDGPRPPIDLVEVQASFDAFRQRLADEAAYQEEISQLAARVT